MLQKIKQLTSQTAVYGISTILARFLNFLFVPLYSNLIDPHTFGIQTILFVYISVFNVIYVYGLESSYFKYATSPEFGTQKEIFSTPLVSIFMTSSIFTVIIYAFTYHIGKATSIPAEYHFLLKWSAWILFFDALCAVPFASLRIDNKAMKFAMIKLINITINLILNIVLILIYRNGIKGIFISNFFASLVTFLLLIPVIKHKFTFSFPSKLYKELLAFGIPYIPSGLSVMMITVINRIMMEKLSDLKSVGLYQMSYRLGIVMMLVVSMFEFAWRPFFLANAKEPDAKPLFARILTYFTLIMAFVFIFFSLFIDDIVKIPLPGRGYLIGKEYWSGLHIVPVILLSYLFNGLYMNFIVGVYIEKKTKYLPLVSGLAAITNIIFNFLLIPKFTLMGAAYATLLSYVVMAYGMFHLNQKFYPVKYEFKRLSKIAVITGAIFILYLIINNRFSPFLEILIKMLLIFGFIVLFFIIKFFNKGELIQVKEILSKVSFNRMKK